MFNSFIEWEHHVPLISLSLSVCVCVCVWANTRPLISDGLTLAMIVLSV